MKIFMFLLGMSSALILANTASAGLVWHSALDGDATAIVGSNGVATGAPTPAADINGTPGGAVRFDGDDFFTVTPAVASLSAGTISFWAAMDDLSGEQGAVAVGASGGGSTQYFIVQNASTNGTGTTEGDWRTDLDDGSSRQDAMTDNIAVVGVWQHVAATFTAGGTLRLYIDGVLQSDTQDVSGQGVDPIAPTNNWLIGAERTTERFLLGALDDVRIYDMELDQAAVTALFNDGPLTIPEPTSLGLFSLGLLASAQIRRRR